MTDPLAEPSPTAEILREEFDHSFVTAPLVQPAGFENLLAVRIGGDRYAIRVGQIDGLHADCSVVALPTPVPELLGLVNFRGQLAPVYDLGALLGYSRKPSTRWLVLARWRAAVALAFEMFEAHLRVPAERVMAASEATGSPRPHLRGVVQGADGMRPIVDLPSVLEHVQRQVQASKPVGQLTLGATDHD